MYLILYPWYLMSMDSFLYQGVQCFIGVIPIPFVSNEFVVLTIPWCLVSHGLIPRPGCPMFHPIYPLYLMSLWSHTYYTLVSGESRTHSTHSYTRVFDESMDIWSLCTHSYTLSLWLVFGESMDSFLYQGI